MRLAIGLCAGALLVWGCGAPPAPAGGGAFAPGAESPSAANPPHSPPQPAQGGDSGWAWERVRPEELKGEDRAWWEAHREQLGIFQRVADDRTLILIAWGQKPTGGYQVRMEEAEFTPDGHLQLLVRLREPAPGEVVTQVLTFPHDVIAVRPARHYVLAPVFIGAVFYRNAAFEVEEPQPLASVRDRLRLRGRARVWGARFIVEVEDGHDVLLHRTVQADEGAPAWGRFDVTLELERQPSSPYGVVALYEGSPKDGSRQHLLIIPIRFETWEDHPAPESTHARPGGT